MACPREMKSLTDISDIRVQSCPDPKWFPKPYKFISRKNNGGSEKHSDFYLAKDVVCVVLFNTTRKKLIFVKQFRPSVYLAHVPVNLTEPGSRLDPSVYPPETGVTLELCGGIVDKASLNAKEAAVEEILEECGYSVRPDQLEHVVTMVKTPPTRSGLSSIYYAEVTDEAKVEAGGGLESEDEVIVQEEMSIAEARRFLSRSSVNSPTSVLVGLTWFMDKKAHLWEGKDDGS